MRIAILLSTYNGAAHLGAQLDSIAEQTHPDWTLLWRDDGSTDNTVAKLGNWACGRRQVSRVRDQAGRLGVLGSFLSLLRAALDDPAVDAVAFADQDDYWLPYKLARAVAGLGMDAAPTLYCARQFLVDGTLRPIAPSAPVPRSAEFPRRAHPEHRHRMHRGDEPGRRRAGGEQRAPARDAARLVVVSLGLGRGRARDVR